MDLKKMQNKDTPIKDKMNILSNEIKNIGDNFQANPENIAEFISFSSNFYNYSYRNTMLIYSQRPGAIFCASFKKMKDLGYSVGKGEKGLKVLVPTITTLYRKSENSDWVKISEATKEDKEKLKKGEFETRQIRNYKIGTTFDVTQTNCPTEDYPKLVGLGYSSEQHAKIYNAISKYANDVINCPVLTESLGSGLRGYFSPAENRIAINEMLQDTQKLSTLCHELGHAIIHNSIELDKPLYQIELEADCFSVMLERNFDIELTDARKEHLANHFKTTTEKAKQDDKQIGFDDIFKNVFEIYKEHIEEIEEYVNKELGIEFEQKNGLGSKTEKTKTTGAGFKSNIFNAKSDNEEIEL